MARVWLELFDPKHHADFISTSHIGGVLPEQRNNLLPRQVLCVEVCSFTFQFLSEPQLQEAISYFSKKYIQVRENTIMVLSIIGRNGLSAFHQV